MSGTIGNRESSGNRRFASLGTETLSRKVARAVIGSILVGEFGPGEELPAAGDLAREFGVSRPVVREALKVLGTLGMVASHQGRNSRVALRATWNDLAPEVLAARLEVGAIDDVIADGLEMRRVIETEAAALAAERATDADLTALRSEFDALARSVGDTEAYTLHDVAFHDAILRATHNRLFLQLLDQMRELLIFTRTVSVTANPDHLPASQDGHELVMEAIEAHSPTRARQAMTDHLGWAERVNVEEYRSAHPTHRTASEMAR